MALTPFKPGQSGNPNGRPKMPPELIKAFRDRTQDALNTLVEIMNDKDGRGSERVKAAEVVLDRAWGKPIQAVDASVTSDIRMVDTSNLTPDQKAVLAEVALASMESDATDD